MKNRDSNFPSFLFSCCLHIIPMLLLLFIYFFFCYPQSERKKSIYPGDCKLKRMVLYLCHMYNNIPLWILCSQIIILLFLPSCSFLPVKIKGYTVVLQNRVKRQNIKKYKKYIKKRKVIQIYTNCCCLRCCWTSLTFFLVYNKNCTFKIKATIVMQIKVKIEQR